MPPKIVAITTTLFNDPECVIHARYDVSDFGNKVDFYIQDHITKICNDKWNAPEFHGFLKHLANSIRKRCRDFGWHTKLNPFSFSHHFAPSTGFPAATVEVFGIMLDTPETTEVKST